MNVPINRFTTPSCASGIPTLDYKILLQIMNPTVSQVRVVSSLLIYTYIMRNVRDLNDAVEFDVVVVTPASEFNEVSASSGCVLVVHLFFIMNFDFEKLV